MDEVSGQTSVLSIIWENSVDGYSEYEGEELDKIFIEAEIA